MPKQEEHFETPAKRGTAIKQGAKNKEPEMTMEARNDNGGVSAESAGYARGAELTEQREQSQTMEQREQRYMLAWYLCRVVTEFAESKLV